MKPQRIQRKRTKGWKMPENTVNVTRPGKWGNPFAVGFCVPGSLSGFGWMNQSDFHAFIQRENEIPDAKTAVRLYDGWLKSDEGNHIAEKAKILLRGKNLACWCKPGDPCHADVLIEIANQ